MQVNINVDFGYDQIFELARQLSPEEKVKLVQNLQRKSDSNFGRLSEDEDSCKDIDRNRQQARQLALECPIATEEEVEMQDEFRRIFRCRPS